MLISKINFKKIAMIFIVNLIIIWGCFTKICIAAESDDYIHYQLGIKYKSENKLELAIDEFKKLLAVYPDNYNAYMQIAEIRMMQNQPRIAIYNFKKALTYNPGWSKAQKALAEAYEMDRQYQNAIIEYQNYQQNCDPAEVDSIQLRINNLIKRIKGEDISSSYSKPEEEIKEKTKPNKTIAIAKEVTKSKKVSEKITAKSPAQMHFEKAVSLFNQERYDESLAELKNVVSIQKNFWPAYFYAGIIRFNNGQYDMAKINFTKAFSYPEKEALCHFYMGKIYGIEKNFKEAINHLTVFLTRPADPSKKQEAIDLLKQYKAAINDNSPIPDLDSNKEEDAEIQRVKAISPETTITTIEMRIDSMLTMVVIDTLSDAGQAMLNGFRDFNSAKFDNAIKEFKKVMISYASASVTPACIYNIGICYMKLRLFQNAENQFNQLIERYPKHFLASQAQFFKAYSYFERGEISIAEKLFREYIQNNRNHSWNGKAYEKLGDIYLELKQTSKAIDAYNQAVSSYKTEQEKNYAYYKLGNSYLEANNIPRAIEVFQKIIEISDKTGIVTRVPDSYYRIADQQYKQKNYKQALENYQKVTRKFPSYQETPWGLFQIGNIYKNTKNYQKAIDTYKLLIKTYPEDYWAKQAKWKIEDAVWENEYSSVLY